MSYSFTVKAATKDDAKAAVEAAFDNVVAQQPIHARDKAAALANASAVIDLLMDVPADKHVSVSVNGYVGWMLGDDQPLNSASVSAGASLVTAG
jgi:hypothetical protein